MRFLPGSHNIIPTIRANDNYLWAFSSVSDLISENFVEVPATMGECVLLNHGVIHGSWPNLSGKPRVALVLGICPIDAQLLHYVCRDGEIVEVYKMQKDSLYTLRKGGNPHGGELMKTHPFKFSLFSENEFKVWLNHQEK